jgi:hypothetical protein
MVDRSMSAKDDFFRQARSIGELVEESCQHGRWPMDGEGIYRHLQECLHNFFRHQDRVEDS